MRKRAYGQIAASGGAMAKQLFTGIGSRENRRFGELAERVVCASHFDEGNDLRSSKNVVGLMRHLSVPTFGVRMPIFRPNNDLWIGC